MKRIFLLAAVGVAGIMNANTSKEEGTELKLFYHPIILTSSCGYTQTVEVGPTDQPDCWVTDLQQMEDECFAPFTNPKLVDYWP